MTSPHPPSPPTPLLELRDITKTYFLDHTAIPVLHGINLTLYPGEFVALRGASGSGKSTLMNILGCLDHPSSGQYWLHGRDISNLGRDERTHLRRETFGFIFQSYHLIASMTALANVEIPAIYHGVPARQRHQRAHALLSALGLSERTRSRPNQLSGGQQQRVSIARALMNGGAIILADEPTGALDSHSGAEVMRLLQQLSAQGHTIILITHDPDIAAHAQRCIEMKDGVIVSDYRQTPVNPAQNPTPLLVVTQTIAPIPENSGIYSYLAEIYEASITALRALGANWFRSLLTLLGIVIGVASVIAMLAVGEGARQQVLARISAMGTDLLLVRSGAPNQRGRSDTATLLPTDAVAIAELPNVLAAVPEASGAITVRYQDKDSRTSATATSEQFSEARQWPVAEGSFFTAEDVRTFATVAVLGKTVAKALFGPTDPVGHYIIINNLLFQVIGVMSERGASPWGSDQDDAVWVPITTGGLRLFGQSHLRSITIKMADTTQMTTTTTQVDQLLMQRHGLLDFNIRNMASLVETEAQAQQTLTLLLGSIAAISLLVGGIGVMNIMLVSVTERTREIGIRIATGARTRNILQQFMIEALVVSAVGGVLGVLFGLGAAWILQYFEMPVIFSSAPIILALACALGTGLVFGWLPAHKAARLDPVTALASE